MKKSDAGEGLAIRAARARKKRAENRKAKNQVLIDETNRKLGDLLGYHLLEGPAWDVVNRTGLKASSFLVAFAVVIVAEIEKPTTVRNILYQLVGSGVLPSTDTKFYDQICYWTLKLRRCGEIVPYTSIVDNMRQTRKPQSWSGLRDFLAEAQELYRLDFWAQMADYVCVVCEKDAVAGTLNSVTYEYDIALHPLRGNVSDTFAYGIAGGWREIPKPIYVYYFGDHDPKGLDIERDIIKRVTNFSGRQDIIWKRLGVTVDQAVDMELPRIAVKKTENLREKFIAQYGDWACELEALPSSFKRELLKDAIESHIDKSKWEQLKKVQAVEAASVKEFLQGYDPLGHT